MFSSRTRCIRIPPGIIAHAGDIGWWQEATQAAAWLRLPERAKVFTNLGKEFTEEEKNPILSGTARKVLQLGS